MDIFMSINYSADIQDFLTYILDNLFSFCHKDEAAETSETRGRARRELICINPINPLLPGIPSRPSRSWLPTVKMEGVAK
jgi:hypothetical protein